MCGKRIGASQPQVITVIKESAETAEAIRKIMSYDAQAGIISWLAVGKGIAGLADERGYIKIYMLRKQYRAHRVAWLLHYGEWPSSSIDHIDMDKANNKMSNLRLATKSQNSCNKAVQSNNTSGFKGVTYNARDGFYQARIRLNGKTHSLGYFKDAAEAGAAYNKHVPSIHGEFARGTK